MEPRRDHLVDRVGQALGTDGRLGDPHAPGERWGIGPQGPGDAGEAEQVGPRADATTRRVDQLRGTESRFVSGEHARLVHGALAGDAGTAEPGEANASTVGEQHVLRHNLAVDDAMVMGVLHGTAQPGEVGQALSIIEIETLGQRKSEAGARHLGDDQHHVALVVLKHVLSADHVLVRAHPLQGGELTSSRLPLPNQLLRGEGVRR